MFGWGYFSGEFVSNISLIKVFRAGPPRGKYQRKQDPRSQKEKAQKISRERVREKNQEMSWEKMRAKMKIWRHLVWYIEKTLINAKICEKQVREERNVLSEEVVEESQNGWAVYPPTSHKSFWFPENHNSNHWMGLLGFTWPQSAPFQTWLVVKVQDCFTAPNNKIVLFTRFKWQRKMPCCFNVHSPREGNAKYV